MKEYVSSRSTTTQTAEMGAHELTFHSQTHLQTIATELGADFKLDLTCDVTHLIVGCITTPKYRYVAKERPDIKVLKREWLEAVRQQWIAGGDVNVAALEAPHRLPAFFDLRICITGFEDIDERNMLAEVLQANGAEYHADLTKAVTHLVCRTTNSPKYLHGKQWGIQVVSEKWYKESLKRGMTLDEALYDPALPSEDQGQGAYRTTVARPRTSLGKRSRDGESQNTEETGKRKMRRTASTRLHSQSQDMWSGMTVGESKQVPPELDQWRDETRDVQPERPSLRKVEVRRSDVFQIKQVEDEEPQGLFAGRWITISGFPRDKVDRLKSFLEPNGATVVRPGAELEDASSNPYFQSRYLLVPRAQENGPLPLPDVPPGTEMVTEWWVERCIHYKHLFEPSQDPLSRPMWDARIPAFAGVTICSTGFTGPDFRQTAEAVKLMGAVYEENLSSHVSALISGSETVKKEKAFYAAKHNIPVVSAAWLWRCLETKKRVPYDDFKLKLPVSDSKGHSRSSQNSPAPSDKTERKGSIVDRT